MSADHISSAATCGCCEVEGSPTPIAIFNRPGLSSIRYRLGTYSSFLLAMTEQIARTPELRARFLTRSTDDFGIALLAMWSWVADILTFYQERTANEAYLRTAILPESVSSLAALLGYKIAPGAAAEADLVFIVEPDRHVIIPIGLRVQSVPGQNEKPQKFETADSVDASGALNLLRVFPLPSSYAPFAAGSSQAVLLSDPGALTPGVTLAIFNSARAELKQAAGVSPHNSGQILTWKPAVQSSDFTVPGTQAVVYGRQFRLFGYNAPSSYLQATPDIKAPGGMRWVMLTTPYTNSNVTPPPAHRLALDASYRDLKPGGKVLVAQAGSGASPADSFAKLATVTAVSSELATDGPLQSTVTWLTLDQTAPITDIRRVTVFEVTQVLAFSQVQYADSISGGSVYIPLANVAAIANKRIIMLDDEAANPQTVQIDLVQPVDTDGDGVADHWQIAFTPDLSRALSTASAVLYGNVCASTHGETVANEILGDGDASTTFQTFQLRKSPVTFVHHPGSPHGVANTLQIQSGGVIWKEVASFFGQGSNERIFVTSQNSSGMTVEFGDGVTGRRLTTGRGNVSATYRQGIGLVGNVGPLALRTLLDRPVGLKSVTNPAAASGGADPEQLDQARSNAPNTVRTFGRIVSLRDFEDAAREFAGVAKAHSSWEWSREEQVVCVTVAGEGGAPITGQTFADLVADLDSRRDPNRAMRVRSCTAVPIKVAAMLFVSSGYVTDDVLTAVQSELISYFSFENRQFGEPAHLSNIYAALQAVAGVAGVDVTLFQYKNPLDAASHGATADSVQIHMRINDNELAMIADAIGDAAITLGQAPA